jgi:hypothetical protein
MTSHSEYRLSERIIALSIADQWPVARAEWDLFEVYFADEPETCLCSNFPILEVCVLRNRNNGNRAEVGNVCVNKFLGLPSKIIFDGIKRVSKDRDKALNDSAAHYAFRQKWVTEWEFNFLVNTSRQRSLSAKQQNKRVQINERVLLKMKRI